MRRWGSSIILALSLVSACSSPAPETVEACVERFADNAELIEFLNRDSYGVAYTYRMSDTFSHSDLLNAVNAETDAHKGTYQITDGAAFVRFERSLTPTDDIILEGCKGGPDNTTLVRIERVKVAKESI